ncbi:hypothetical protein AMR72_17825 [Flavobacterium psychrophilum]|nr:hypothetical protein AMR72_17825 [Flavobacterium psychrophilum]AOE54196.1 hypothetical protein ALW18_17810 [Flavobacterium psychrophilum]
MHELTKTENGMKKITLFLTALLFALNGYAQLPNESFESWTAGQGPTNWMILQNNTGLNTKWVQSTAGNTVTPPNTGTHAAYLIPENVLTGMPEDYLVSPLFNSPVNGRINFYSRFLQVADQSTVIKVKILPAGADASILSNYVELQSWTELELNPGQTEYVKTIVNIPAAYENTQVRIAFVVVSDFGDRFLLDDVEVVSQCTDPTDLSATNIGVTTATLNWINTSGATKWEIELKPVNEPTVGTGIIYNGSSPYSATNLVQGTEYKFYVRSLCADGGKSDWIGPVTFTTVKPGDNCLNAKVVTALPYVDTDDTANYFDVYQGSAGGCGTTNSSQYLNGNDVTYAYTATQNGVISINVSGITDTYAGVFVYTSCAGIGTSCYAGAANDYITPAPDLNIPTIAVTAGTTYYIVISSWFAQTVGYKLTIQQEFCDKPTDVTATDATYTGITLGWTSSLSAWEYVVQPVGTGLPLGNGTAATTNTVTLNNLTQSTQYEVYVRANCGDGTYSSWTGPTVFNTACGVYTVPFFEGFDTNSTTQFCWTVADENNDGSVWDLDFTYATYEGDQSAKFDVSSTSENNDWLISPAIQLSGNERLSFYVQTQEFGAVGLKVMASTTGNAPEDFTIELSPLTSYAVAGFTKKTINLSSLPAGPVYLALHIPTGVNGGYEIAIDNFLVEAMPACAEPTDILVNNLTSTSAHLQWTPGNNETAWEIVVVDPNVSGAPAESFSGTPLTSPSYDPSSLAPNTLYQAFVRAVCGPTNKTFWSSPFSFTTKCAAFDIPFFEGFNSDSASENCWKTVNGNGDWAVWDTNSNGQYEGDEAASIYTGNAANNDWLISPAINLTGNERLKFHYKVGGNSDTTGFRVLMSTTNSDLSSFTEVLLPEATYTNQDYLVNIISLAGKTGPVYFAWQVPPVYEFGDDLFIDNVMVETAPACAEPLYVTTTNITQTSAEVNWQAGGTETEWELFVNVQGENVPTTGIAVTSLPYTLTGLQPSTPYEITVKAICGSNTSPSSDKATFVTKLDNNDCDTAREIPVNVGPACDVYAFGTLDGATESSQENPCGSWTNADDDVWFNFTATAEMHTLSLISGTQLMYMIYEGDDCNGLTQVGYCMTASSDMGLDSSSMILDNLTIGKKYTLRVFSPESSNIAGTFKVCIKIPVTPIAVNNTQHTVEQLVKDVLFSGDCAQVSNVTWSTGTNFPDPDNVFGDNPNGIAYFNKNGSDFPFQEGVLLTTGNAMMVPGPNYKAMEHGSAVWPGDTDIDEVVTGMLGAEPFQPTTNASVIEFDFVPTLPTLSLDFLFASEEYGDMIQCFSWDTFAILLTDDQGNKKNIAVIPETTTPISVFSISGNGYPTVCPGYNLEYFDKYNVFEQQDYSNTAFNGQTVVMTAKADVIPNQQYHLKIAIAETDNNLDSGVFIKGGVNGGGSINLGDDLLVAINTAVCDGQKTTLETNLDADVFEFEWTRNNTVIAGQTGSQLVVSEPGTYSVSANVTGYSCVREDTVVVEFYAADVTGAPQDLTACDADGFAEFNLALNTPVILDGLTTTDYTVTYHLSATEAEGNTGAITSPYTNTTQTEQEVFVRIENNATQCYTVKSFKLIVQDLTPLFTITPDFSVCENTTGTITVTPTNFNTEDVTISWTLNGTLLPDTTASISVDETGDYVVTVNNKGCTATATVKVTVLPAPVAQQLLDVTECGSYTLPELNDGNSYYTGSNGTGTLLEEGKLIDSTQEIFIFAQSNTTPNCTAETSFLVTITPQPEFTLEGEFTACRAEDVTITVKAVNFNTADAVYEWTLDGAIIAGNESTLTSTAFGTYGVTVSIGTCTHTENVVVELNENAVEINFVEGCENNIYMLEAIAEDDSFNEDSATYSWTGPDDFTSTERKFAAPKPGIYTVVVTTADGCTGEKEIIISATTCKIPKGISPNNDGSNDEFDLTDFDVRKITIFNRYGQEVYSKANYEKEWHGQDSHGRELPTGTYFYMIERGQGETKTGWVYINREE